MSPTILLQFTIVSRLYTKCEVLVCRCVHPAPIALDPQHGGSSLFLILVYRNICETPTQNSSVETLDPAMRSCMLFTRHSGKCIQ